MEAQDLAALSNLIESSYEQAKKTQQLERKEEVYPQREQQQLRKQVEQTLGANFKAPRYDILYRQQVSAEEVYGGFYQLTPACADAQFLVIKIHLPGEVFANLDLNITKSTLTLFGKIHRLHLELPHDVDEQSARAKFSADVLEVRLRRIDNVY